MDAMTSPMAIATTYIDKPGSTIQGYGEQAWRVYLQGYPRNALEPPPKVPCASVGDSHRQSEVGLFS